jgi:CPA1 family monovalent cation:H+ antiporter
MGLFGVVTVILIISSLFSYVNARWIKLPGVIGVMLLAILSALFLIIFGKSLPFAQSFALSLLDSIDFSRTLLNMMLGFLLFASALHFDVNKLKGNLRAVVITSTVGVMLSALLFAALLFHLLSILHLSVPIIYCLVFGALISPTDAVAVSALLKKSKMPERLRTIINGESLFNDGIGIVLFITFSDIAAAPLQGFSWVTMLQLFAQEVFGGVALGLVTGALAYRMMRTINDFQTIVLISFTLVMSISVAAAFLHVSIPLAVVIAGLLIGSRPFGKEASSHLHEYLDKIWSLSDDLLNTILFVLIGLQMISITFSISYLWIGIAGIIILLIARAASIILPVVFFRRTLRLQYNSIFILTWGGLRGGISVALALSLPASEYRELILTCSFFIVVFSVIVQGLTLNRLVEKLTIHN